VLCVTNFSQYFSFMKQFLLSALFILSSISFAQTKNDDLPDLQSKSGQEEGVIKSTQDNGDSTIYTIVERMPEFPGGQKAMQDFIISKVKSVSPKLSGKLFVKFVVEIDGSLSNCVIAKTIPNCETCEKEALKIIAAMPKWSSGEFSGKKVRVYYMLPIKFDQM